MGEEIHEERDDTETPHVDLRVVGLFADDFGCDVGGSATGVGDVLVGTKDAGKTKVYQFEGYNPLVVLVEL